MTSAGLMNLEEGTELKFSLAVEWKPTSAPFHSRFERYLDNEFFEHQIHWFSIFNAFMMVIFLCGLVAVILVRTLRRDYQVSERSERALRKTSSEQRAANSEQRAAPRLN